MLAKKSALKELFEARQAYEAEPTSKTLRRFWDADVKVYDETDKTMSNFVVAMAEAFVRANLSISRLLKCLEICGVEVVDDENIHEKRR